MKSRLFFSREILTSLLLACTLNVDGFVPIDKVAAIFSRNLAQVDASQDLLHIKLGRVSASKSMVCFLFLPVAVSQCDPILFSEKLNDYFANIRRERLTFYFQSSNLRT